jgi:hypothetical protein
LDRLLLGETACDETTTFILLDRRPFAVQRTDGRMPIAAARDCVFR